MPANWQKTRRHARSEPGPPARLVATTRPSAILVHAKWENRSTVPGELALRPERRPKPESRRKRLWRGRGSGVEANSVYCGASALGGGASRFGPNGWDRGLALLARLRSCGPERA